jgi:hypothetical protein
LGYGNEIDAGNERTYREGSGEVRKNLKSDIQKYQSNGATPNYQSMFRNVPKNSKNPRKRF